MSENILASGSGGYGILRSRSHDPLIRKSVFDRVQAVMMGKFNARSQRHDFPFRRLLTCHTCRQSLIGELQKGNVYYRCHKKTCPKTSLRQEVADTAFSD